MNLKNAVRPLVPFALTPCLLSLMLAQAYAAEPRGEATALQTVVVTATATAVDIKDAPASISVITREEIERQPVHDLATLLRRIPGVTGGQSPNGEQSKIKLRGLPENYTLILVDGRRQGNSTGTNYRPDLGRQDLNWLTPEMIERIEVVRGPMSSLYGSDAMGGVINIITRKIPKAWGGSVSANATVPEDSGRGDAYQGSFNLAGPVGENLGLRLGGGWSRQEADETTDGFVAPNRTEPNGIGGTQDKNVNALLQWRLAPEQTLTVDASAAEQRSLASSTRNAAGTAPVVAAWGASKLVRQSVGLAHEGRWRLGNSRLGLNRSTYDNEAATGDTRATDTTLDGHLEMPLTLAGIDQTLTVGAQWKRESLRNNQTIGTLPVDPTGRPVSGSELSASTSAVFAEDQLYLARQLTLTLGARLDHHGKFGNHVSPRAYVVYHPSQAWTVKGGVSQGFRAPSLTENTAGAATQSRGNGCSGLIPMGYVSGGCYMAGNPNLEPETSTNAELGLSFASQGWDLGLTYFHTDFRNKIDYVPLGFFQGYWWTQMQNIQKARTEGLEGTATLPLTSSLSWRNNLTWMFEAKNLSTGAALLSTPKVSLYSALGWQANERLYAELSAQHTGRQLHGGGTFAKAYTVLDLLGTYQFNKGLLLRAGVQNLTEEGPRAEGKTSYYVPSRRYFVGLTQRF